MFSHITAKGKRLVKRARPLGYLIAALLPTYVAMSTLGMLGQRIATPLSYVGDSLGVAMNVKGIIENGWYLSNDSLGVPDGMRQHDYPGGDNLCCLCFKLLGYVFENAFEIQNVFLLLTFCLAGISAYAVLRRLRISVPASLLASVLFSLLPYHFYRGTAHLFYSAYFLIPPLILVAVWLARGALDIMRATERGRLAVAAGVVAILGCNGVYYPIFGFFVLAIATLFYVLRGGKTRPALTGILLMIILTASVVLNQLPILLYLRSHGAGALVARAPEESEFYALKIVQLLLPVTGHRLTPFAALRDLYDSRFPLTNENGSASLGLLGSFGLLFLLGWLLFRPSLIIFRGKRLSMLITPLSVIAFSCILFATVGGFSSLLSVTVFSKIRAYNRISPFIAFCALATVALVFDAWVLRLRRQSSGATLVGFGSAAALLVLGILDQTTNRFLPDRKGFEAAYAADHKFFSRVQATVAKGTMIFQLPYMPFPEAGAINKLTDYLPFRGYLHTQGLRWSYGANKGRLCDKWQRAITERPAPEFLRNIVFAGFNGIEIERQGYVDGGEAQARRLEQLTGAAPIQDERREFFFFDISDYARHLRADYAPAELAARERQSLYLVATDWGSGFSGLESDQTRDWRWASSKGVLQIDHEASFPRQSRVQMRIVTCDDQPANLHIRSDFWNDDVVVDSSGIRYDRRIEIPPGAHTITFECDGKPARAPGDPRELVWRIDNFILD